MPPSKHKQYVQKKLMHIQHIKVTEQCKTLFIIKFGKPSGKEECTKPCFLIEFNNATGNLNISYSY